MRWTYDSATRIIWPVAVDAPSHAPRPLSEVEPVFQSPVAIFDPAHAPPSAKDLQLILAAPVMLEALRRISVCPAYSHLMLDGTDQNIRDVALAAIKAAVTP